MVAYLNDSNAIQVYNGSAWVPAASGATLGSGTILQVVSTTKQDAFTTTSATFVDVTGLSATITPRSTTSKILAFGHITNSSNDKDVAVQAFILVRGATEVGSGTPVGARLGAITADNTGSELTSSAAGRQSSASFSFLDSPATTSATTYKIQIRVTSGKTGAVNRSNTDTDNNAAQNSRTSSTITLMEVAG
jgi:hypothetical protein